MPSFSNLYSSRLTRELGTDDTVLFTTIRRKNAINEGVVEFANATECLTRRLNITVVAGQQEYDLNSTTVIPDGDFSNFSADGVEYRYTDASSVLTIVARQDLPRVTIDELNQNQPGWRTSTRASTVMGLPEFQYVRTDGAAFYLGFTPTLGIGSSASAAIMLSYIAEAPTLTSDTSVPYTFSTGIRQDLTLYHQGIVHYAASQLEKYRKDRDASQFQMQQFLVYVSRYFADQRIKGGRAIRQAKSYFKRKNVEWGIGYRMWPWGQ